MQNFKLFTKFYVSYKYIHIHGYKTYFIFNDVNTSVVPLIKSPETVELVAVAVPVNAGLANGAFNAKSVVVALLFNDVNTFVVPFIKLPETIKLTAVPVPVNAGLSKDAF